MRSLIPSYALEMGLPARRPNLRWGVRSGYALTGAFLALALLGGETGIVPHRPGIYALLAAKLATNTLAWATLANERQVLFWSTLNMLMDVVVLTGGVHFTGGALSPLFATYVILIAVVALLTNRGVTITVTVCAFVCHSAALTLGWAGVIETFPPPASVPYELTGAQLILAIGFAAFTLGVTTAFTTGLVVQRDQRQRALEARTRELLEAGTQKSLFMANITHELRTPIHGICGVADVLDAELYGPVSDDQKEAHRAIRESAKGMLRLIDDLLTLARSEAGSLPLRPERVIVDEVVEGVASAVRWMIGTKSLELVIDLEPDLPRMTVDRGRLVQVLVNLMTNAVKFTPDEGRVGLVVRREGEGMRFEISDSGIGIPIAEQARVFEAFRQVDGSDERAYGGVGLGLAIVHRVVAALGGRITFESAMGEGTTFRVWLPMEPSETASE